MGDDLLEIRRVLGGDVEAFRGLVERHQGSLFCLLRNLLGEAADVEDLAQDVFLAAYRNLSAYDPRQASFATWLLTIARNKCVNARKKRRPLTPGDLPEAADERTPD